MPAANLELLRGQLDVRLRLARARRVLPVLCAVELAGRAGITPDPWQARVLGSTSPRILLNCSRQSGKSTITAVLAVHQALFKPGSLTLLLSPTLRQSGELFKKCLTIYRMAGTPLPADAETALSLSLGNGSRIVSLPGKEATIRGYSAVALLIIDEAAWVSDDLYLSLRPMLSVSQGRLVALSTPHGNRGFFYQSWEHGGADWERYLVPASDCPRISATFLEEEQRSIGPFWYGQEYECQFLDAQSQAFRSTDIEAAFTEEVTPWAL